jgi:ferredoxin
MNYRVEVKKELCISSAKCVSDAPKIFKFDEDELAEPVTEVIQEQLEVLIRLARNCPGEAITIYDENGSEINLE